MSAESARSSLESSSDDLARSQMWHAYGLVLAESGETAAAVRVLQDALAAGQALRNKHPTTQLMIALAEVERLAGCREVAAKIAAEAVQAARAGQFAVLEAQALDILGIIELELGQLARADETARRVVELCLRTGYAGPKEDSRRVGAPVGSEA
jgi:hypothetical protein